MYIIKSGKLVFAKGTFGRRGKFHDDPTMCMATMMTAEEAEKTIKEETAFLQILADQYENPEVDFADSWAVLNIWKNAKVAKVVVVVVEVK